jgi:hypothetical protein
MTAPYHPKIGERVTHRLSGRVGKVKMLEYRKVPGARVQFDGSTNAPWIPLTVLVPAPKKQAPNEPNPDQLTLDETA